MANPILERFMANVVPRIKMNNASSCLSPKAAKYFMDIVDDPDVPLTTRGDRLGYNAHMTTKVKNELISKGFVKQYQVNLGRANKFLEITDFGYEYFNFEIPKQRGKGGPEHRYWQRRILKHNRNSLGLRAKIEGNREGKLVDVAVTDEDGKLTAIEIALTPKNEMSNIKKDLSVGFDKVLIACKNKKVKEEVERKIEKTLDDEDRVKVETCLLTNFT